MKTSDSTKSRKFLEVVPKIVPNTVLSQAIR